MGVLLLTGPPASEKNAIATSLAAQVDRLAVVDVDLVRHMVVQPHDAPWEGTEGQTQLVLGVRNACRLADEFSRSGYHVLILDVLTQATAETYRIALNAKVVRLLPSWAETERRSSTRTPRLTLGERHRLYDEQQALTGADLTIDNSGLSADLVAEQIRSLLAVD